MSQELIKMVEDSFTGEVKEHPSFGAGDTITVHYKIREGNKERVQNFRGVVIQVKGTSLANRTFTVRKMSGGIGVERIFPLSSPFIEEVEIHKYGKVRRKRIYYFRKLTGKKARIKERRYVPTKDAKK
ncbi:MAG: 50S ribosomal protein L19 [Bacteroidales bacterium]